MRTVVFVLFVLCTAMVFAENKTVHFTSLEWAPYSSVHSPSQGTTIARATSAFATMGYTLKVDFFPWSRAVLLAKSENYEGYLPEYFSEAVQNDLICSDVIEYGPLGFIESVEAPVLWSTLEDLEGLDIGVVQDYINTAEFDQRVTDGRLNVQSVITDVQNIKKVSSGRIPLAVIDKRVYEYLLATDPSLGPFKSNVRFNSKLLGNKALYACFKNTDEGRRLAQLFNAGLKKIGPQLN